MTRPAAPVTATSALPMLRKGSVELPRLVAGGSLPEVPREWRAIGRPRLSAPNGVDTIAGATANVGVFVRHVLLEDVLTGDRKAWVVGPGGVISQTVSLGNMPVAWHIAGTGDFNGDGFEDILWENTVDGSRSIWFMNGSLVVTSVLSLGVAPVQWHFAGVGDYSGDGKDDILLENTATGDRVLWVMNGAAIQQAVGLGNLDPLYHMIAARDLNSDGKPDIMVENNATGARILWLMNGYIITGAVGLGLVPAGWRIAGSGDINGDGKNDIQWESTLDGLRLTWLMNGAGIVTNSFQLAVDLPEWRIVGILIPSLSGLFPVGSVANLSVIATTQTSATLSWTQGTDGAGGAASYDVRRAVPPFVWATASSAGGTCGYPVIGTVAGTTLTCNVTGLTPGTLYNFQMLPFRSLPSLTFGAFSNIAAGTTQVGTAATVTVTPSAISTFVGALQAFTAVVKDAGGNVLTGQPITWSTSSTSLATVTAAGVDSAIAAGVVTITATSGTKSGTATDTVLVAPSGPSGGGGGGGGGTAIFTSTWGTATGTTDNAISDGGKWNNLYGAGRATTLTVIAGSAVGFTLTPNVMRLQFLGPNVSGVFEKSQAVPASTTNWGRFYFRNDETQWPSQHAANYHPVGIIQLAVWDRWPSGNGFSVGLKTLYDQNAVASAYPYYLWRTGGGTGSAANLINLPNATWFRYEWMMEYVTATTYRLWPRIYDMSGSLLYDANNYVTSEFVFPGAIHTTLQQWYNQGHVFGVTDVTLARDFGMGNEGPAGTTSSGGYWYFANVALSLTGWIGP